jgi:hypothetical protein
VTCHPSVSVVSDRAPLSFQQEHVWRGPAPGTHTIPSIVIRLSGELDSGALQQALDMVVARHASLRTSFCVSAEGPEQRVVPDVRIPLATIDCASLPEVAQEERVSALLADANRPYDLAHGPLLRAGTARMGPARHVMFFAAHHLVADLWSTKVFIHELSRLYAAVLEERDPGLPPLRLQYPGYARWQRERFEADRLGHEASYWRARLDTFESLRFDGDVDDEVGDTTCELVSAPLTEDLSGGVLALGRSLGVTPFTTLLGSFFVMAYGRTHQSHMLVDSLVANRDRGELEAMIGMFAGSLPLRAVVRESMTFAELVRNVQEDCLSAYAHQHLPFRKVQEITSSGGDCVVPRPRVCFALQAAPFRVPAFGPAAISAFDTVSTSTPTWDQWWQVVRRGSALDVVVVYKPQVFTAACVREFCAEYIAVLDAAVRQPGACISELLRVAR